MEHVFRRCVVEVVDEVELHSEIPWHSTRRSPVFFLFTPSRSLTAVHVHCGKRKSIFWIIQSTHSITLSHYKSSFSSTSRLSQISDCPTWSKRVIPYLSTVTGDPRAKAIHWQWQPTRYHHPSNARSPNSCTHASGGPPLPCTFICTQTFTLQPVENARWLTDCPELVKRPEPFENPNCQCTHGPAQGKARHGNV